MSAQIASSVFLFQESVFVLLMVQTIALCNQRICFQRNEVRIRVHRTGDLLYIIALTDQAEIRMRTGGLWLCGIKYIDS